MCYFIEGSLVKQRFLTRAIAISEPWYPRPTLEKRSTLSAWCAAIGRKTSAVQRRPCEIREVTSGGRGLVLPVTVVFCVARDISRRCARDEANRYHRANRTVCHTTITWRPAHIPNIQRRTFIQNTSGTWMQYIYLFRIDQRQVMQT